MKKALENKRNAIENSNILKDISGNCFKIARLVQELDFLKLCPNWSEGFLNIFGLTNSGKKSSNDINKYNISNIYIYI